MTLRESWSSLSKTRRAQGLRTTDEQILTMAVLGYLCGCTGYRPLFNFCKANEAFLIRELGLKHGVPSHVTFREVLMRFDDKELTKAFNDWTNYSCPRQEEEIVSIDGKALKSTLANAHSSGQDFIAAVSLIFAK